MAVEAIIPDEPSRPSVWRLPRFPQRLLVGLAIFAALAAWRFRTLDSPPYYDFAIGLWPEADYLAKTGFDYGALRHAEPHALDVHGGPRSYMTSAAPAFLAVLMLSLPSPWGPIVVYHLFTLACAAAMVAAVGLELAPYLGRWTAVAACLALATTPVVSAQLSLTGMEIPLALAVLLSPLFLDRDRPLAAVAASLAAFLIKPTGLLASVACLAMLAIRRAAGDSSWKTNLGLLAAVIALAVNCAVMALGGSAGAQHGPGPPLAMAMVWSPDVVFLMLAAMATHAFARRQGRTGSGAPEGGAVPRGFGFEIYAGVYILLLWLAANEVRFVPRYVVSTVPLLYILLGRSLGRLNGSAAATFLFVAVAVVNLFNQRGELFPDPASTAARLMGPSAEWLAREGSFLERSREWEVDQQRQLEAIDAVASLDPAIPVVCGFPFNYFLAMPELGYVKEPRTGYSINGFIDAAPTWRDAADLLFDLPRDVVFLVNANGPHHQGSRFRLPEPETGDEILYAAPDGGLTVFRKRFATSVNDAALREWYRERLWPKGTDAGRAFHLARGLRRDWSTEERRAAEGSIHRPADGILGAMVQEAAAGRGDRANASVQKALSLEPDRVARLIDPAFPTGAWATGEGPRHSRIAASRGAFDFQAARGAATATPEGQSLQRLFRALATNQRSADMPGEKTPSTSSSSDPWRSFAKGIHALQAGQAKEAIASFETAISIAPHFAQAWHHLALARARAGDRDGARIAVQKAWELDPFHPDAEELRQRLGGDVREESKDRIEPTSPADASRSSRPRS